MIPEIKEMIGYKVEAFHIINWKWYQLIKRENGNPDPIGILVLAEIVYWYTPYLQRSPHKTMGAPTYVSRLPKGKYLSLFSTTLAEKLGCHVDRVRRSITNLCRLGLITTEHQVESVEGELRNDVFIKLVPSKLKTLESSVQLLNSAGAVRRSSNTTSSSKTKTNPNQELASCDYPPDFEEDWQLYKDLCWDERQGHKTLAFKQWRATLKREEGIRDTMMRMTKNYLIDCQVNHRYCKNASTLWGKDRLWSEYDRLTENAEASIALGKLISYKHLSTLLHGNSKVAFRGGDRVTACTLLAMKKSKDLWRIWDGKGRGMMYQDFSDKFLAIYPNIPEEIWGGSSTIYINSNVISAIDYDGGK